MTEKEYYRNHVICPDCLHDEIETTCIGYLNIETSYVGYLSMPTEFRDNNKATCLKCGWRGIVHDLKAQQETAILQNGLTYSGPGPGGEFYSKEFNGDSISLWTKGEEHWTADELRAIADHQDWMNKRKAPITRPARAESIT